MNPLATKNTPKLLIIRFSSVGDVIQTLGVVETFLRKYPTAQIHWAIRSDLQDLIAFHPNIQKVFALDRKKGLKGLYALARLLQNENYTHVYDAHNNLRSHFLSQFLNPKYFLRRSKNRLKRVLLFVLRKNLFGKKFVQQESFLRPLEKWGLPYELPQKIALHIPESTITKVKSLLPQESFIAAVPTSAWELKMWPLEHWKKLFSLNPNQKFVLLGGPSDHFIKELAQDSNHVINLAGKLSLIESCAVVALSKLTIGNDTGLSHAADQLQVPLIQFIGPVLFGYPARDSSIVMETPLPCRPCTKDGRGVCKIKETKKCLVEITPESVTLKIQELTQ